MTAPTDTPSLARQKWLEAAVVELRDRFTFKGFEVPANLRVSVGWPKGSHGGGRAIGQCWALDASSDEHSEIFISPEITTATNSARVLGVLAHELAHATVGTKAGHKAPFKRCAEAIGLTGKMTATTEGEQFLAWANGAIERIGQFPAGSLSLNGRKKQSTRLLKCECTSCGYVARVTKKWVEQSGAPVCPADQEPMSCDGVGDDDEALAA
jgi:hypothetical protein